MSKDLTYPCKTRRVFLYVQGRLPNLLIPIETIAWNKVRITAVEVIESELAGAIELYCVDPRPLISQKYEPREPGSIIHGILKITTVFCMQAPKTWLY